MSSLQDRVAIVTGGAQGIGRAIAEKLASEGATVVIADMQAAHGVARELGCLAVEVDVSDPAACERMAAAAIDAYGRIINMASGTPFKGVPFLLHYVSSKSAKARVLVRDQYPEDIVGAVAFFAGDGAAFITGQSLVVDGGAYFN